MATKTLEENINQAISDFNSVRAVVETLDPSITTAPTSEYGGRIGFCFSTQHDNGYLSGKSYVMDLLQAGGTRTNYAYAWSRWGGVQVIYPNYMIAPSGANSSLSMCSYFSSLKTIGNINFSGFDKMQSVFYGCSSFLGIDDGTKLGVPNEAAVIGSSGATSYNSCFFGCSSLEKLNLAISGVGTTASGFAGTFTGCSALTDFTVSDGGKFCQSVSFADSPLLTYESLVNIRAALNEDTTKMNPNNVATFNSACMDTVFANQSLYIDPVFTGQAWSDFWMQFFIGPNNGGYWSIAIA